MNTQIDSPRFSLEEIDVDERGTFDVSRRGRSLDDWQPLRVEPAWFVPREKGLAVLSRRLLSEASPTSGAHNKTQTFRLAAILDHITGAVHLVSVCRSNGEARVTRFAQGIARCQSARYRSVALREVLAATMSNGCRRFEVIGSARTKEPTEFFLRTFANRREFRELFACPIMEAQRAVQSGARVSQVRMEAFGFELGRPCQAREEPEQPADWEMADEQSEPEPEPEPEPEQQIESDDDTDEADWSATEAYSLPGAHNAGRLNLNPTDVWMLREWMPVFSSVDELIGLLYARHPDGRLVIGDELYEIIERIAGADVSFFTLTEEIGFEQALKTYGY